MNNNLEEKHNYEDFKKGIKSIILLFKIGIIIMIISFCVSGFFFVEKNETAFVLRLGTVHKNIERQGLSFALPKPIDNIIKISKRPQTLSNNKFMYQKSSEIKTGQKLEISPVLNPTSDGYLITKDQNIIHLESNLTYQIIEPVGYAINTNKTQSHLKSLLNSTLVKIVANKTFSDILSTKNFQIEIKDTLQKYANQFNLGIEIVDLNLQVYYPKQVETDYLSVNKQRNESSQLITEAHSVANLLKSQATNESIKIISGAENLHTNLIEKTKDALTSLEELQKRYKNKNEITKKLLLYERLGKIFKKIKQTFIIPQEHRELRINIDKPVETLENDKEQEENNEQ